MSLTTEKISTAARLLDEATEELRLERERSLMLARQNYPQLNEADFNAFLKEPYVLVQRRGAEWYCIVPKWVNFSVGWLERATESFNIFLINRYTLWLGDVSAEIRAQTGLEAPPGDLSVVDGKLVFNRRDLPVAQKYRDLLSDLGTGSGRIKKGREFDLLARMIDDGYLPFAPRPVDDRDRRAPEVKFNFAGKYDFQRAAYDEFLQRGAVGVYWMTGAGKSFVAMAALDSLKGRKLIVVPTRTLVDQWKEYFKEWAPRLHTEAASYYSAQIDIFTYNAAYEKAKKHDYVFTLFDECHRLPATSFAKLSTIKTKYRMGLSASPYREDNRTNYIIALTGHPIGMDWRSLVGILGKNFHMINVWIVANVTGKLRKVDELFNPGTRTIIFSDSIDMGTQAATRYGIPHIHGSTSKRLDVARSAKAFVASRVMDMGVSINDLEHIIEIDFLFGSRQQEVQRTGRLFHSSRSTRHDIIMTRDEFDSYGKRLHGLVEKGFKVNVHQ